MNDLKRILVVEFNKISKKEKYCAWDAENAFGIWRKNMSTKDFFVVLLLFSIEGA